MKESDELNSIAVWLDNIEHPLHLDVNIWITDKKCENYIELGIKIPGFNSSGVKVISLYLPYSFQKKQYEDKGAFLSDNNSTLSALFNEELKVEITNGSPFTHVELVRDSSKHFHLLKLNDDNVKVSSESQHDGTLMTISIPQTKDITEVETFYSRIRINSLGALFSSHTNKSYLLSSKKETDSYIDFKVNTPRSLPRNILTDSNGQVLGRINMFLLTESNKNIVYETGEMSNARLLERHIWDSYLKVKTEAPRWPWLKNDEQRSGKHKIAYQWLKTFKNNDDHDYSLFVKMSSASTNWSTIIIALVFIYLLSLASEYTSAKYFTTSKEPGSKQCIDGCISEANDPANLSSEKNNNSQYNQGLRKALTGNVSDSVGKGE